MAIANILPSIPMVENEGSVTEKMVNKISTFGEHILGYIKGSDKLARVNIKQDSKVSGFLQKITAPVKDKFGNIKKKLYKKYEKHFIKGKWFEKISKSLKTIASKVGSWFFKLLKFLFFIAIFDPKGKFLTSILNFVTKMIVKLIEIIAKRLPMIIEAMVNLLTKVIPKILLVVIPQILKALFRMFSKFEDLAPEPIKFIFKFLKDLSTTLLTFCKDIKAAGIGKAIENLFFNLIGNIKNLIPKLLDALLLLWNSIFDYLLPGENSIKKAMKEYMGDFYKILKDMFKFIFQFFEDIGKVGFKDAIKNLLISIVKMLPSLLNFVFWTLPKLILKLAWELVKIILSLLWDLTKWAGSELGGMFIKLGNGIWEGIKRMVEQLWTGVKKGFSWLFGGVENKKNKKEEKSFASRFLSFYAGIYKKTGKVFFKIIDTLFLKPIKKVFKGVFTDIFNPMIEKIKGFLAPVIAVLGTIGGAVLEPIIESLKPLGKVLKDLWDIIQGKMVKGFQYIKNIIGGVMDYFSALSTYGVSWLWKNAEEKEKILGGAEVLRKKDIRAGQIEVISKKLAAGEKIVGKTASQRQIITAIKEGMAAATKYGKGETTVQAMSRLHGTSKLISFKKDDVATLFKTRGRR